MLISYLTHTNTDTVNTTRGAHTQYRAPEFPYLLSHVKASSGLSTALSTLETYWNLTEGRFPDDRVAIRRC
ncbi:hypothetical protein J6590_086808 [Homalodisca vitripennis]|nr:hypothetical protein J6590_086808 [Homalodisca vitripennis]